MPKPGPITAETRAATALLEAFGRIVVINLPARADRRHLIDAELRRAGLSLDHPAVEVFAAIRPDTAAGFPSIGAHGAYCSHLAVMERMIDQGWERVLVLEDDMAFAPGFAARLPALARALATRKWGMLYGHPGDLPHRTPAADADGLITLPADLGLIQLHFFGLTRDAVLIAAPMLRAMRARPTGSAQGGPMHVDGALNWVRAAHPGLISLAISPEIAQQRASPSDIAPPRWYHRAPMLRHMIAAIRRLRRA